MGILNDPTAIDSYAINAYCIVSALFFATCGYAQLNDPNPLPWLFAYVFGGTIPNLYWMTLSSNNNASTTTSSKNYLSLVLYGFVSIMVLCILYKMITVAPKLFEDVTQHHHGLLWAFMEHEEGRDSCGLLLLILHVLYMNAMLLRGPRRGRKSGSSMNGSSSSLSSSDSDSSSGTTTMVSPTIMSLVLLCIVGVSIYVWIVHHPEMVAKYGVPHCQGSMFGREDNNEL